METNELLINLYDKTTIREIENQAINKLKIDPIELTKRAAQACTELLLEEFPKAQKILVFCGVGKNAEDGLYLAEQLINLGKNVQIIKATDWEEGFNITADIIIDALFGIGINRELIGVWQQIIDKINISKIPVLSVDIPSGIEPDTGQILGTAIKASTTVTFIGLKPGLFTGIAKNYTGNIKLNNLGLSLEIYNNLKPRAIRLTHQDFKELLLPRAPASHKGNFGKLLIMGGQDSMVGSTILAGQAALRTGTGVVHVLTNSKQSLPMHASLEIQMHNFSSPKQLKELINKATVLLLGPGLGTDYNAQLFFEHAINSNLPLVIDADGLNLLAENFTDFDKDLKNRRNWILTPHPQEAARLLNTDVITIENNRFAAIEDLTNRFKATVVLKGAGTLIKSVDSPTYVCDLGNPGMATAGMGDLLSGIIASLVAQHLQLKDAATLGVFMHSIAGDAAAKDGQRGLIASDLLPFLRKIVNTI